MVDNPLDRAIAHRLSVLSGAPQKPTSKFTNLKTAMKKWVASGCQLAPRQQRKIRIAICSVCPHWNGDGNIGLGECLAPGCGCTRAKVWLATERCPLKKW